MAQLRPDIHRLQRVIEAGDIQAIARLLYDGLDVNMKFSKDGDTILFAAIRESQEDIVRLLVSEGADVTAQDSDWLEPVHQAAKYGNPVIMDILLKGGADVNKKSKGLWMSPLYLAVKWQQVEMVKLLLSTGADCNQRVGQGQKVDTALHYAVRYKDRELIDILLCAGASVNSGDGKRQKPLHVAAALVKEDSGLIEHLLDCGSDVHALDQSGDTAVHVAVVHGNVSAIRILYKAGADLNRLNNKMLTPTHLAVSMGRLEVIKLLIDFGANLDKPGLDEMTPLLYCHATLVLNLCYPLWEGTCSQDTIGELCSAHHGIHMSILDQLIKAGCDMNHPDTSGRRLLNYLVKGGIQSEAAVRKLLIEGADHDKCTIRGVTLLMIASHNRHSPTTRLILKYCPSLVASTPVYPITFSNPPSVAVSALVVTARYRDVDMVQAMLDSGYHPTKQELNLVCQEDRNATDVSTVKHMIETHLKNPSSLLLICRVSVRRRLNNGLHKKICQIEIPNRLKDLLLLNDILEV